MAAGRRDAATARRRPHDSVAGDKQSPATAVRERREKERESMTELPHPRIGAADDLSGLVEGITDDLIDHIDELVRGASVDDEGFKPSLAQARKGKVASHEYRLLIGYGCSMEETGQAISLEHMTCWRRRPIGPQIMDLQEPHIVQLNVANLLTEIASHQAVCTPHAVSVVGEEEPS